MLQEVILAFIVSFDTYLVAAAYCNSGIRIPLASAAVINLTGAAVLGAALVLSDIAGCFIPAELCRTLGLIVLTSIGVITVFKSLMRLLVRRLSERGGLSLRTGSSGLVIKLYLDDTAADTDGSKSLSPSEAAALALASSLDSAATGLSCGFCDISPLRTAAFAFFAGFAAVAFGSITGRRFSASDRELSWLGGVLLIAFAVTEAVVTFY
ncbi:putative sporulation protein YtaF [Ruminococcus sp. YRD2003]|uniref:manganese efflux pump n=1 Tax=Ruminococcus sp. YRD2003 TaxID=1452313 RepID=UPI0008CB8631|nr:manganese efflux pump [Ruminococcus sp.]SEL18162.1 putative sporulation protein YtaF [Ruminococcus flavefaciens]